MEILQIKTNAVKFDQNYFPSGRFPHPEKYLCEISRCSEILFTGTITIDDKNNIGGSGGHINTCQGRATFQRKNNFDQNSLR